MNINLELELDVLRCVHHAIEDRIELGFLNAAVYYAREAEMHRAYAWLLYERATWGRGAR